MNMLGRFIPVLILVFIKLLAVTSSQSCIRNELLTALVELENCSSPGAQIEELNSTLQQIREDQREAHKCIKDELQELQEDVGDKLQGVQQSIQEELRAVRQLLSQFLSLGASPSNPAQSCKEIYDKNTSNPSGYYWLHSSSEKFTRVYCDMERTCGGVQGGWMKVMSINASNTNNSCPSGLRTRTSPKRLCTKTTDQEICSSAKLDVHGVQYSQVCGKIIGYQYESTDAFGPYYHNRAATIDNHYVDGISLTHGSNPRKHIWTFAAALHEIITVYPNYICPCTNIHNTATIPIPPYVGNDYFCDTASERRFEYKFYPDDPLWDGDGCGRLNTCCSFNNPPWFMKQLPASTHDDIEMRLCSDSTSKIVFETLDLYVR